MLTPGQADDQRRHAVHLRTDPPVHRADRGPRPRSRRRLDRLDAARAGARDGLLLPAPPGLGADSHQPGWRQPYPVRRDDTFHADQRRDPARHGPACPASDDTRQTDPRTWRATPLARARQPRTKLWDPIGPNCPASAAHLGPGHGSSPKFRWNGAVECWRRVVHHAGVGASRDRSTGA
jgi:hypothetical protein